MTRDAQLDESVTDQLVLSDLINRVLDKGIVLTGSVVISVADVDLVRLDLSVVLRAMETELTRERRRERKLGAAGGDVPVLPDRSGK